MTHQLTASGEEEIQKNILARVMVFEIRILDSQEKYHAVLSQCYEAYIQ